MIPLPNLPGTSNNLLEESEQSFDSNQYNVRLDQRISSSDYVFARAAIFDAHELDPYGSTILNEAQLPAFGRTLNTHTVDLTIGETHTFSSNLLNEFRFGWMKVSGGQGDPNVGNPFATTYGLKGTTANPADQGYPQINLSNEFTTLGSPTGFTSRVDRDFELVDNVMLHKNAHTIQFGGYFFHLSFNPRYPNNARGVYTYSGAYTGTPLGDFLKGEPASAQVGLGEGAENATTNWAHFYVQDDWRIKPSLVLNLGLRYEYNANLVAGANQTSDIDLTAPGGPAFVVAGNPAGLTGTAAVNAALSPIPIISAATVGWNNSLLTPRNVRFSPRLGLAWQVPGQQGMVVRAGFGVFTNQASYSILQNLAENMPFFFTETVTAPAAFNPNFSTENILSSTNYKVPGTIGANSVNHSFRVEYNEVYNLSVQKAVTSNTTIEAEYVGSRTIHADSSTVLNMPVLPPGGNDEFRAIAPPVSSARCVYDNSLEWLGDIQWPDAEGQPALYARPFFRDHVHVVEIAGRCVRHRHDQQRIQSAAELLRTPAGKRPVFFRSPEPVHGECRLRPSHRKKFHWPDACSSGRLENERAVPGPERGSVYREPFDDGRKRAGRCGPGEFDGEFGAPQCDRQSQQRSPHGRGMVQHRGVFAPGAVYFWIRRAE